MRKVIIKMVQKESSIYICDNTNVRWTKTFQLYKGFHRKHSYVGFFIKGSSRVVEPPRIEYKGFKYKYSVKGDIIKKLLVRSNLPLRSLDSRNIQLNSNSAISLKKKQEPKSKFLLGPTLRASNRRRINSLFNAVL